MMLRRLQLGLIVVLLIVIVLGIMSYVGLGKEVEKLKEEKTSIKVPEKNAVSKEFNQQEVKEYEDLVKEKLNAFQQRKLSEGEFNTNNSGVATVRFLFAPPGGKIITEKDSVKEYVDYYSKFDYKISDVTAHPDGAGGGEVYFRANVKLSGNDVNPQYELVRLQFNENKELIGGSLYEKQK